MEIAEHRVGDLESFVAWVDYDATKWRDHPEPAGQDNDDDEDEPATADVKAVLGFDPDELW